MTFEQALVRYREDVHFGQLVDLVHLMIGEMQLTPGEARDAAMLASLKFELGRPMRAFLAPDTDLAAHFAARSLPPGPTL